jgi:hypothetical protein
MTEQEWLNCEDPLDLDPAYWRRQTDRQFWLYYCACFRRIWHLLTDERSRCAVEALERHADGQIAEADLKNFERAAYAAYDEAGWDDLLTVAYDAAGEATLNGPAAGFAALAVTRVFEFVGPEVCISEYFIPGRADALAAKAANPAHSWVERRNQAGLVRHIRGNPFHRRPQPSSWSSPIVKLAEAIYAGEDCSFALHDALLEAGHPELAEHFKDKDHPKGCWVLDLLLGKE